MMREFHRSFQPNQFNMQQEEAQDSVVDWGGKEWGTHRFHIRQLLEHAIEQITVKDKAVVLGAGNHGDVDLPWLADLFMQVTVMDTEPNSIEEVLELDGAMVASKVKSLTNVDYTCLDQIQFYETWEEMLLNEAPANEVAAYIRDCAFRVRSLEAAPSLKRNCSLVVSSSVHTQLFYIHALSQFAGYSDYYGEQGIGQIIDSLKHLRNSLINDYNRMLLSLVKPEGYIVMWSDMIRVEEHNQALLERLYELQTDKERNHFLFQAFGQYGIEAAVLGLKDLHDHLKVESQLFKCWVWIPSEEKKYIVAGMSGIPRQ